MKPEQSKKATGSEDKKPHEFTDEQIAMVKFLSDNRKPIEEMVQTRVTWNAVGRVAGSLKTFLSWFVGLIAAYAVLKTNLLDWIKAGLEQ